MIGVLLIGAGAVVDEHYCYPLRRLEKAGALRVLGVADPNESSAQRVAAQFKQARTHADASLALVAGSYDLAIIASPPGLHADHACAALAQGCHVLCEKPMTTTIADATRMNTAAAQAQRVLGVAFSRRYSANFADVAKLVAEGELGDDLQFSYHEGSTYRWAIATGAAFDRERSGGGALMDRGVHMLDQLNWVFGDPVVVDRCYDDSLVGGVETNARLELSFPRARGTMQVSWEFPLNNGLHIRGSRGEVKLDGDDIRSYRRKTREGWTVVPAVSDWPADMARTGGKRIRPANSHACFEPELIAMLRAITYGEPFPVTGVQAAAVQSAIEQAYASAEPLECPWLPPAEQAAARAKHWKAVDVR